MAGKNLKRRTVVIASPMQLHVPQTIATGKTPEMDVYKACEWPAVGLLSALSVTNGGRPMKMPDFRKNMTKEEMKITL